MRTEPTVYHLDKNDRIVAVGGPWDEFANENGGLYVRVQDVLGRLIWEFVTDDITRMWLDTLLQLARIRQKTVERFYRCDSPELKRFMCMRIIPEENSLLRIEHEVLSVEQRAVPVHIRFAASVPGQNLRLRCSVCGRVKMDEVWQEPVVEQGDGAGGILVAYSVCETCVAPVSSVSNK